jgi:alpha-glucoside transport system substrate-binding protein
MIRKLNHLWMVLLVGLICLAACASPQPTSLPATGAEDEAVTVVKTSTAAITVESTVTEPAQTEEAADGGSVTVIGIWDGTERDNFMALVAPFEERTGIDVKYEQARDITDKLTTQLQAGKPPDIAGLPGPSMMRQLAAQQALVPLDNVLDIDRLRMEYPQGFTDLAQIDGQTYGLFIKASVKNLVWYRPDVFQERGYQVPESQDELQRLEKQIISEGYTPWCIGVATGWPGTDWIEDTLLGTVGPETYNAWWQHRIAWTDPAVAGAWQAWGRIVGDPAVVYGGQASVLSKMSSDSAFDLFGEKPNCFLHHQANFITTYIIDHFPEIQLGADLNFFPNPPIDEQYGHSLLVAGDMFGMFNDTPQARALMAYLATAEAQAIWAEKGGYIAPNRAVSLTVYPDEVTRAIAKSHVEAETVRFDASDLLPQAVQEAFIRGVKQFVRDPDSLPSILEGIESIAQKTGEQ